MFQQLFQGLQAPADPQAVDPQTGMPAGDVHAAQMQSLRNMSALFMAAGQSMSGADRAKILAQLGDAQDPSKQLYSMAQARLMNQNVADSLEKRRRRESALGALQSADLSQMTERERQVFETIVQSGDTDAATNFLTRVADNASQGVMLPDGSQVSKGIGLANQNDFNKRYAPMLDNVQPTLTMVDEARTAVTGGLFAGTLGEQKLAAAKALRAVGIADPETVNQILNSENLAAATMDAVLGRMSQLGGNDSNEELRRMQASLAGGNLEPETLLKNLDRLEKSAIEKATHASEKYKRLTIGGQMQYNAPIVFAPEQIYDPQLRARYDRITGTGAPATSAPAASEPAQGATKPKIQWKVLQ